MDNDAGEKFDISFIKARAKNHVESNILSKQIRRIDRQFRRSLMRIESGINEEKRFVKKLKSDAKEYRDKDESNNRRIDVKVLKMEKMRRQAYLNSQSGKRGITCHYNKTGHCDTEAEISVNGEKVFKPVIREPKMYFWSQDASTKLAVMTSFYGYQLNLKRSMTEVKLLGQQMYPEETRVVQSAEPTSMSRHNSMTDLRRAKTSVPANYSDDEFFYHVIKQAPPPTPKMVVTGDLRTRDNSFLNDPKSRENSFMEIYINGMEKEEDHVDGRVLPVSRNAESRTKTFISKTPTVDYVKSKTSMSDHRPKTFPKMQESPIGYIEKAAPEKINVDTLQEEGKDGKAKLPLLSHRSVGTANGKVRPTKRPPGIMLKTRGEVTRQQQENMSNRSDDQGNVITELERSYSNIPSLMSEINRMKTTLEFTPKAKCGQYSKSAFGLSMQSAIKQKVFKKTGLPVHFKKNHNTMLKHYGTPIMEQKTRKIQTVSVT